MTTINVQGKEHEMDSFTDDQKKMIDELLFLKNEMNRISYTLNTLSDKYQTQEISFLSTLEKEEKKEEKEE